MAGVNGRSGWGWFLGCVLGLCAAGRADSVVVVNEIMYHPAGGGAEWVELYNQMGVDIDLSGWSLEGAVEYRFAEGTLLESGGYLVAASDPEAVRGQAERGAQVVGPFAGRLANEGETIRLVNPSGRLLNRVEYGTDGDWPAAADGSGVSLARIDPRRGVEAENWTWSDEVGGTPGAVNFASGEVGERLLRINEIGAGNSAGFGVELFNAGADSISLEDYALEVDGEVGAWWALPAVVLGAGERYVVGGEDLGVAPSVGDRVILRRGEAFVSDAVRVTEWARGRYPDGAGTWYNAESATLGAGNEVDLCTDLVINEVMYHPMVLPEPEAAAGTVTLVPEVAAARTMIPPGDMIDPAWRGGAEPFDDSGWVRGTTGIGYERSTGYEPYIGTDTSVMYGTHPSVFVRIAFEVEDPGRFASLVLSMRYDDGFVAWLNGVEIGRANAPEVLTWNAAATASHNDMDAVSLLAMEVPGGAGPLKRGTNVLAIHGLNVEAASSDLLIQPKLEGVEKAQGEDEPEVREESRTWVELYNRGEAAVDVSGWGLAKGIRYVIPEGTVLEGGGYLVVAKDAAYLRGLYPEVAIVGDFSGRLSNGGEAIVLEDARGNPVDAVRYYDGGSWPSYADGGGCSLELRDPRSDNNVGTAWAASDESARTAWREYSYRGIASSSPVGNDSLYREFVMGLLYDGEVLIDDLRVIEDPEGAAVDLLQNGDFSTGAQTWRIIGNHRHSEIVADPEDAGNPVLRLVATGPTEHMHNHAETTLAGGRSVQNGRAYEIRFRARWVAGSPLLHTRLFFNRLARTTVLGVAERTGTPGRRNSRWEDNIGPTLAGLRHEPAVPISRAGVTVRVRADDPDGVASMTLWHREDGGAWQSAAMAATAEGYRGAIAEYRAGTLVQFYVEAVDSRGQVSWCPAAGPESFAQYRVSDGKARTTGVHNYRIVMRDEQRGFLYDATNLMSNDPIGATLIVNEEDVYYDVGVRLKSSEHGRPKPTRVGFSVYFRPEHLFRGVHDKLGFDRSNGQQVGQQEMLVHAAMNRYGGFSKYHDLGYVIAPDDRHSSGAEVQMARFDRLYCEEAYGEAGGDGTLFEYELVYPLTATVGNDPEGLKIAQEGGGVQGLSVSQYLGEDKELYRWHFLIKHHRDRDDYDPVIGMTRVLGQSGSAFAQAAAESLDVASWLRAFAIGSAVGVTDNWLSGSAHNALFYHRPTDDRMVFFLHDLDYYSTGVSLKSNSTLQKLTQNFAWNREFYGNVYDFLMESFNREYLGYWADHYGRLLPEQSWNSWLSQFDRRHDSALGQVLAAAPAEVAFRILERSGQTVRGEGWIHVKEIRHAETEAVVEVSWQDWTRWEANLPEGVTSGTLRAYNSAGRQVGTAAIP